MPLFIKKFEKPCKRSKYPYYRKTDKCYSCESNPDAIWTYERKRKEFNGKEYLYDINIFDNFY